MIETHSVEAEHGLLGAMMMQPHLIDVLTDDLSADAFAWPENAELYRLIIALNNESQPIDVITLAERREFLADDLRTMSYAGEIIKNTPSVANAKTYARIVKDRAVARQILSVSSQIAEIAHEETPIQDKISSAQALVLGLDGTGSDGECQLVAEIWAEHIEVLQERHNRTISGELFDGLSTGLPDLDKFTQGLKPGQMITIAGRPAMGKTTLAMNIAAHVAVNQKLPVVVFSLEMSKTQLMDRLASAIGGIPLKDIKSGVAAEKYSTELAYAGSRILGAQIVVSDVSEMTMPRIRSIARRQKHKLKGMGLIVVDYLGLVEGDGKGRVEDVTAMSRQIKLLAREMGCPVLILSQLNRSCESRPDKRPVLSDLRESGAIEQDSDIVVFVYRDEVYFPNSERKGVAEILIRKNRDGEIGVVYTAFQGDRSRFVPLAAGAISHTGSEQKEDW